MKIINILKRHLNLALEIDSHFNCKNKLESAEFEYHQLNNTAFDFKYKQKNILHFTNIESARLILESNYLRGSNFNNFEDKFEIIDVLNKISTNLSHNWEDMKARTFAISFTEKTNNKVQENYEYHWQNYANKYRGVAFEFEITNSNLPCNFYPLRVNYIEKDDPVIRKLKDELSVTTTLNQADKDFLLPILAGTKDRNNFEQEEEVRLMYRITEPIIEHLDNSPDSNVFFSFKENNSINLELRVPFSTPKYKQNENLLILKKIYLGNKYFNSYDQLSSSILMNYFKRKSEERGIEIVF